jgi:hypothetical protein
MSTIQSRTLIRNVCFLSSVFVVQLIFFTTVAFHRFVDGDEGFYLLASRLVLAHKKPYVDFFYTQAPLLPYVYGVWSKLAGVTWTSAKFLSALLTAGLGALLTEHIYHETRSWLAGLAAVVLFPSSSMIFAWFPVVKTYSLAAVFLFACYVVISSASKRCASFGVAGILLGLSVATRSYLLLLVPLFAYWFFRNTDASVRRAALLWFLGGVIVGNLLSIFLFLCSPSAFVFNNLGYHAIRSESGLIGSWEQKIIALVQALLGGAESNGLQTSILFLISLGLFSTMPKARSAPRFAFQLAVSIVIISMLPTPVHPQYFCLAIPFLLVSSICAVTEFVQGLETERSRWIAAAACALVGVIYVAASAGDLRRYLITADGVAGVEPGLAADQRLDHVLEVSRAIDQIAAPGEEVASFWPGFLFQTQATAFPGFENDFALPVAELLTADQRAKYHVPSREWIDANFAAHRPRVVVLRDHISVPTPVEYRQKIRSLEDSFRKSLTDAGYARIRSVGDTAVYACCQ